jgi:hypothetical protein
MYWLVGDEAPNFVVDVALGTTVELDHDWRYSVYVDGVPVRVDDDETPLVAPIDMSTGLGRFRFPLTPQAVPTGGHTVFYIVDSVDYFGIAGLGVTVFRDSHVFPEFEQTSGGVVQERRRDFGVLEFPDGRLASGRVDPIDGAFTLNIDMQPFEMPLLACPDRSELGVIVGRLDGEPYRFGPDARGALFGISHGGSRLNWPSMRLEVPTDGAQHRLVLYYVSGIGVANEEVLGSGVSTPGTLSARSVTNLRWPATGGQ